MKNQSLKNTVDGLSILFYALLAIIGWLNLFSTTIKPNEAFDFSDIYGKQLIFMISSIFIIIVLLNVNSKIFEKFSFIFYILGILSVIGLFFFGKTVKGQTNWYEIAGFSIQPSEFVKISTLLFLGKFLSDDNRRTLNEFSEQIKAFVIIGIPMLIILSFDPGSALVFISLIFVLYREGLPNYYLIIGITALLIFVLSLFVNPIYICIALLILFLFHYFKNPAYNKRPVIYAVIFVVTSLYTFSLDFVFNNVLEQHHRDRINVIFNSNIDVKREGYNLNQSLIAIGSGGLFGKGYLEGTQTKGGFVPEQHSDYIFTTLGEEWGFFGSIIVILIYVALILRLLYLAELQKTKFARIMGYGVASILFTHFFLNIAMLIKLFPTIGIPLPYFSYGGSSFWAFTILLFIFIKLDANKVNEW
jgi:rod shape determining protein RodA